MRVFINQSITVSKLLKCIFLLLFFLVTPLYAQNNDSFEFYNQDIKDIVYVLSLRGGKSIVCDETVTGVGNFLYVSKSDDKTFDEIFDAFLYTNKLFVIKTDNLWTVSKIKIDLNENGKININSYDSSIASVFEKISEKTGKAILFEVLPAQRVSYHIKNVTLLDAVQSILQPYSEYNVTETLSGIQISKRRNINNQIEDSKKSEKETCNINYSNGFYDVKLENASITNVLEQLFIYSNESYSNFIQTNEKIRKLEFTQKDFETTLMFILEQVNSESIYSDGMWYIFQKVNRNSKDSILGRNKKWFLINLVNYQVSKIVPLITSKYNAVPIVEISNSRMAVYVTKTEFDDINEYITKIDSQLETEVINLKYIKTSDLFNVLPPIFTKDEIVDTGTGNSIFFIGTKDKRELFIKQLSEIDRPKKLVRYDLLILQYDKNSNLSWGASSSVKPTQIGDRTLLYGDIGNLLNINFDAITSFGLTFSEKISAAIANNDASVFADTTLYGLSGEKITFKNTNTYRYKDATIDPNSGKEVYSTVTREITSGLILEIDGWVSGDDIITMDVKTSVSKQGVDTSNKTGNPPTTTEKNITTKIRAKNGEPVVLSGLSQNDLSTSEQGVPGISKIPLLGDLFKSKNISKEKTEMTIYLVPHIEENILEEEKVCWEELLLEVVQKKEGLINE